MYDWANSVYSLTIATAVFPIYFQEVTPKIVEWFGIDFKNTALYEYAVSLSFLLIALISPILSGISDYRGNKKSYMKFFVWLGSLSCMAMYFFTGDNVALGISTLILATMGFAGSLVYYNSYLPDIATPDRFDRLSARGFSMGYLGSVLLLVINLAMIMSPETFGLEKGTLTSRLAFLSVGIWWLGFSQITFRGLPGVHKTSQAPILEIITKGYKELMHAFHSLRKHAQAPKYLLALFIYNMGVQTVMYLATLYGKDTLQLDTQYLIITVLIIQLIAIPGSFLFSYLSEKIGNIRALQIAVALWIIICVVAYYLPVKEQLPFFALGSLVGLVMGGIQSTSRATYAKLLPDKQDTASYFSFYEFTEKVGTVLGTFCYAFIDHLTHDMRNSVIALTVFFVVGQLLLFRVKNIKSQVQ